MVDKSNGKSIKLKELAIEELRTITYSAEFDPERVHALVKLISKNEFLPDAYKGDAFLKRFRALHSDLFTDSQKQNKEYQEKEPELEKKVIQNQELDEISQIQEMDKELEKKLVALKELDEKIKELDGKIILLRKRKNTIRFSMVFGVLLTFFAINIFTYASGKPSVFQLIKQAVNYFEIKVTNSEYVADHDNTENNVEYQIDFSGNILHIVDYSEIGKYFNRTIYLPSMLPDVIITGDIAYLERNGICSLFINYTFEDHKNYLAIELCEANSGEEDSETVFFEGSIYSEYRIRIADSSEILCAYESEEYNTAYLIFNDILYIFRYNLTTEQVINIIKTMEAY